MFRPFMWAIIRCVSKLSQQGAWREGVAKYRYLGSYLWIALGNYGTEVFLILQFLEVSHSTVL